MNCAVRSENRLFFKWPFRLTWLILLILIWLYDLGEGPATKSDEFFDKFQTAFDPSSFSENYVAILYNGYGCICKKV